MASNNWNPPRAVATPRVVTNTDPSTVLGNGLTRCSLCSLDVHNGAPCARGSCPFRKQTEEQQAAAEDGR